MQAIRHRGWPLPRGNRVKRVVRRTHGTLLPAVDVGHVFAGEQERAVAAQQRRIVRGSRLGSHSTQAPALNGMFRHATDTPLVSWRG